MMADEFKIGRKVRVTEDVNLTAQSHGPMALAPIVVQAGEIAVVTDTNLPDFVTLTFDREIPFPADFGGPSREVHSHDPAVSSGLTFDLLQPVHEVYAFRFEAPIDALRFVTLAIASGVPVDDVDTRDSGDEVMFSSPATIEEVKNVMRRVPDGHVMLQTIALDDDYTGVRDYNLI